MKWNPDNWNQIKIKLIAQPSAATRVLFFSVRKKKLFVAKRCHMAEAAKQTQNALQDYGKPFVAKFNPCNICLIL